MSKKLQISLILVLALCVTVAALILVACAPKQHTHTYGEWQVTAATCETCGQRTRKCTECNEVESETIKALGHDWKIDTIQSETCQRGGEYLYTCKRTGCNATDTKTTQPVEHKWIFVNRVEATCVGNGSVTYRCDFGCNTPRVDTLNAIGHSFSSSYTVDVEPTLEQEGLQSKHCTRNGCDAKDDIQTIPRLDADTPIEYTVTIKDPCGEWYYGAATIGFYLDDELVTEVPMSDSRVTTVTLGANNYNVRLSGLTQGYFSQEKQYDIFANQPQLTICLGAAMLTGTSSGNYVVGSIIYDFAIYYYENADSNWQITMLSDILKVKKGILINFYFKGCQPCANEMPALVSVANTYKDDIQVLMVNECIRNTSDDDVKYFQRTYANNSPLWFVTIARSRFLYNYFSKLIGGFPTTILIDCNGQIVYSHANQMSATGFSSVINTYIINRYNKLHPSTETAQFTVEKCEAILPSDKFYLFS